MSNSYTIEIWHYASLYLQDRKDTIDETLFNYFQGAIRARNVKSILSFAPNPLEQSIEAFRTCTQIIAFFSKNVDFSDNTSCTEAAMKRFYEAEMLCKITNKRLKYFRTNPSRDKFGEVKREIRNIISNLLGNPKRFLDSIPSRIRITSGATEDSDRAHSLPFLKFRKVVSCTPGSIPFVVALSRYHSVPVRVRTVEANRIVLVPKNAKTHRTIAAEPHGILPFQLAVDSYIKDRLLFWKVDLSSQLLNQQLALEGSRTGSYATIDLSMASDTMSLELVRDLFPPQWVEIFTRLRSSFYKGMFGYGEYHKFSSMGNGYTFTLETTIFTAVVRALGISAYAVYGDDIVVPTEQASEVISVLRHLGFRTNPDKTFLTGPFRESCGADYYDGTAVRPFFVKRHRNLSKTDIAHLINGFYRIGENGGGLWAESLKLTQRHNIPYVPYSENTRSGVHLDYETCRKYGIVKTRGWIEYAKQLLDVNEHRPLRSIEGLKVFLYKQAFEDKQCGWQFTFHRHGTNIVRYVEPSAQTKGPLLAVRVRQVQQPIVERRTGLLIHYYNVSTYVEQSISKTPPPLMPGRRV